MQEISGAQIQFFSAGTYRSAIGGALLDSLLVNEEVLIEDVVITRWVSHCISVGTQWELQELEKLITKWVEQRLDDKAPGFVISGTKSI